MQLVRPCEPFSSPPGSSLERNKLRLLWGERDKAAAFTSLKSGSFIMGARERRVTPEPRFWGQDCLLHFLLRILDKVASSLSQPQLPQF